MKEENQLWAEPTGERYPKDPVNNSIMNFQKPKLNVFVLGGALWVLFIVTSLIS
ncbi:MAG: hypothetical protein KDD63_10765 [Bacteroidetes bacterium]|nr:hypothetical protein [Bacteroidota bacterium]MCB0843665.1 hypothetical protein [Bacteroidota bacterium]MCB0852698.1 hypothetical protein [Bacteroidota bacterium]